MTNSRAKGNRIERLAVNALKDELGDGFVVERNLAQTRDGGADVILPPFHIEVKGGQQFRKAWLDQAREQAGAEIPVLMWREPRKGWRIFVELSVPELAYYIREAG